MMRSISKSNMNGFKASHGGKSFTVVNTLDLGKTLCRQPCLVPHNNTMCILLVLEYPLGPNDITITLGLSTNDHTLLRLKLLSSSSMASSQSRPSSASNT